MCQMLLFMLITLLIIDNTPTYPWMYNLLPLFSLSAVVGYFWVELSFPSAASTPMVFSLLASVVSAPTKCQTWA